MPFFETYRPWIYLVGAFAGYLLIMFANPARESLRDGFRCLLRYRAIWVMLALFGFCAALFQLGVTVYEHRILPEGMRPEFFWSRPWFLPEETLRNLIKSNWLPAIEGVAGLFNVLITTFPFSALAAILFLANWEGHHVVLFRALRKRFNGFGWIIYAGIVICALAALVKPLLYSKYFLYAADNAEQALLVLQWSAVIDGLSFLFEIMFGICAQIYLMLMAYAWVRGLKFTHRHLMDFAIRRFSYVMKWSAIGMLLGTFLISFPLISANFPSFTQFISDHAPRLLKYLHPDTVTNYVDHVGRPVMAVFFLLFSGMQIILTFHSESLVRAMGDMFHFLRKDIWTFSWFLLVAFIHFYFLAVLDAAILSGLGAGTAPAIAWGLFFPLFAAFFRAWLLASWVCLYKRSEAGRMNAENWIQY